MPKFLRDRGLKETQVRMRNSVPNAIGTSPLFSHDLPAFRSPASIFSFLWFFDRAKNILNAWVGIMLRMALLAQAGRPDDIERSKSRTSRLSPILVERLKYQLSLLKLGREETNDEIKRHPHGRYFDHLKYRSH